MTETTNPSFQPIPTAIVSRPGIMQQSLRSSLTACAWIAVVASFGDGLTALNQLAHSNPALLVIDANLLDEEVVALLEGVKLSKPEIRCFVLAHSRLQRRHLLAEGADAVVLRSGSLSELMDALAKFQDPSWSRDA